MDSFSRYHPFINIVYFFVMFLFSLPFSNPVLIAITAITSMMYLWILGGRREVFRLLKAGLVLAGFSMIINPLFNHQGVSVIFRIRNNPVTWESVIYGVIVAGFLFAMLILFSCFQKVMTADKITVLFGKISPKFALTFSMAVAIIPKLNRDYHNYKKAASGLEKKKSFSMIGALVGLGLEDTVVRADSMAARGYLLPIKKTHVIRKIAKSDIMLLIPESVMAVILLVLLFDTSLKYEYFPMLIIPTLQIKHICFYILFGLFGLIPVIVEMKEVWKWRRK